MLSIAEDGKNGNQVNKGLGIHQHLNILSCAVQNAIEIVRVLLAFSP